MIGAPQQEEIVAFLSRGAAYGKPDATVERIETHASVVFLAGDRAYKLKRAVRYSYLDYSTPEKREAMCRAELRLNRRTAPDLYLGIRKVTREREGALALDGVGTPIDWLLEMKRFPQDALFDHLAERKRLTPIMMRELSDAIAVFHEAAEPCAGGRNSVAMRETADGNIRNLRLTPSAFEKGKLAELAFATNAALARLELLLDRRGIDGHVRHCHGDLHLGNICLIGDKPTLFDGIEFNDSFTCIDTLYDLAFLLMDLGHRDLGELANLVFNRYLDRTDDTSGLPLLPLYLSIRAAVRAHVSLAAIAQKRKPQEAETLAAAASRYLTSALEFLRPARPRLIALGGFSGSGKSTLAQALGQHFRPFPGARIIRTDVVRKRLAAVAPETRLPASAYDKDSNERVYRTLFKEASAAIGSGYTAIADAAFLTEPDRAAIAAVASAAGVPFTGFWLEAPADRLRRRIDARIHDASDADAAVLVRQLATGIGVMAWHRLDASGGVADIAAAVQRALSSETERGSAP